MSAERIIYSPPPDLELFERIACALEQTGYIILPGALPESVGSGLVQYMNALDEADLHRAKTGRGADEALNLFVRRDRITWIESGQAGTGPWLEWTNALRDYLNRRLFLGLFSFESQLAMYEPGAFYKKHKDAFRGQSNRMLSIVVYLNTGWQSDQGGELVIYDEHEEKRELVKVQPAFGTVVLFLSEAFPHEVLITQRSRYSVAGWYRVNGSTSDQTDLPR